MADAMTAKQRAILEVWGRLYVSLEERLDAMSDDELGELYDALEATSHSSGWYALYQAAQGLKPIVARLRGKRRIKRTMLKLKAMDEIS
jgi:hypothetical protein